MSLLGFPINTGRVVCLLCAFVLGCQGSTTRLNQDALARLEAGDTAAAVSLLERAIEVSPKESTLHANLAEACFRQGSYGLAAASQERFISLCPDETVGARRRLAEMQLYGGSPEQAMETLQGIRAEYGEDPDMLYLLSLTLEEMGREQESRDVLEQGIARFPQHGRLLVLQARISLQTGNLEEARETLTQVFHHEPNLPEAHLLFADFFSVEQKPCAAVDSYQRAAQRMKRPEILLKLGKSLRECSSSAGDIRRAETVFLKAAEGGDRIEVLLELGSLYVSNDFDVWPEGEGLTKGMKACEEVIRAEPLNVEARNLRAMIHARRGQLGLMLTEFDKSLGIDPNQPEIRAILEVYRGKTEG